MNDKPYALSLFIACYLVLGAISYQGSINPFALGLLDTIAITLVLSGVIASLAIFLSLRILVIVHITLISVIYLNLVTSWHYFDYYNQLYTHSVFSLGQDIKSGIKAVSFEPYGWTAILCMLLCSVFTIGGAKSKLPKPKSLLLISVSCYAIGGLGLAIVEGSIDAYKKRGVPWLQPANLHPLHAFISKQDIENAKTEESEQAHDFFVSLNQAKGVLRGLELNALTKDTNLNVIVLLLESFRADLTGHYVADKKANTPNFDQIASAPLNCAAFLQQYHTHNKRRTKYLVRYF